MQTIQPATALPTITEAVIIDATTQPRYAGTPLIEIDGTNAAGLDDGVLQITAGNSTVQGLIINRAGFSNAAILISGNGGNVIKENYLGTDAAGTSSVEGNGSGIVILDSANNSIQNNLISGNVNTSAVGIRISGTTATNNQIQSNLKEKYSRSFGGDSNHVYTDQVRRRKLKRNYTHAGGFYVWRNVPTTPSQIQ